MHAGHGCGRTRERPPSSSSAGEEGHVRQQLVDGAWKEAIVKEAEALLSARALVPLTAEQQKILENSGKLVILPAKGVFTVKPPDQEQLTDETGRDLPLGSPLYYKRKARLVICGNFQSRQAQEDSYAGGCQTDSLRVMLAHCASRGWSVASTDIRNAFILAPIQEEDDEEEVVYALYPPKVFQLAQVRCSHQLWRVDRALYGFRRSPRLWGRFRDKRLRTAKIPLEDGYVYLSQHKADENIWSVRFVGTDGSETVRAFINVYVDDILYVGGSSAIEAVHVWITSEWKSSPLTWASEETSLRFLGLEIGRTKNGGVKIHQRGYIEELLRHHGLAEGKGHLTPCPQEWLIGENEFSAQEYTPEQLRRAQAVTGELLWLSGKSRPDLMHTVATMSSCCLKDPILVERIWLVTMACPSKASIHPWRHMERLLVCSARPRPEHQRRWGIHAKNQPSRCDLPLHKELEDDAATSIPPSLVPSELGPESVDHPRSFETHAHELAPARQ